jgi:hypothetical protein
MRLFAADVNADTALDPGISCVVLLADADVVLE